MKKAKLYGKIVLCFLLALVISLPLASCKKEESNGTDGETPTITTADISGMDFTFTDRDRDASYNENSATVITFSDSGSTVSGSGAAADGNDVTVTAAGTYLVSGSAADAVLTVDAGDNDKIQLVLCGLSLTCTDGPALYIRGGDKIFLTLAGDSVNILSDGASYTLTDGDSTLDAAFFSRADLTINGSGSLTVNGNCKHGIVSKDDFVMTGGVLTVMAANVALNGKDCVKIGGGTLTLTAGSDGIRSDNTDDGTRGFVYLSDGNLTITAEHDGIQAQTVLKIDGGTIGITSGGGSVNASTSSSGGSNPMWGNWGSSSSSAGTSESAKGLKADSDIFITGGTITVDSSDDSIHSNTNVEITGGVLTLISGDDGIHANTALAVMNGSVTVTKSYEGLEASELLIAGGTISVVASDDGLNAAGGVDSSSTASGGRPGAGAFSSSTGKITISGGTLLVNAAGDGIDSNGTITVTGGTTLVAGPTNSGNAAFDFDGSATVSGGILMALGSSGMAQGFTTAENQGAILVTFSTQSANTALSLCDEDGRVLVSFTPSKAYASAVITAPGIEKGEKYSVVAGGTVADTDAMGFAKDTTLEGGNTLKTLEMSSLIYGSSSGMGGGMPGRK